jgi:alginate O-acetyltransferase complex protein AlgI
MKFVSHEFFLFVALTWIAFRLCPPRARWIVLLAASYVFYAAWNVAFIAIIIFTTSVDYFASKQIARSDHRPTRLLLLWSALLLNLSVLGVFKYGNALFGRDDILLPLGISYYTFEAISYLVDVYRGATPSPTWWQYNFYIMYFPHLVAGPIVRFNKLWNQFRNPIKLPSIQTIGKAAELIILGYLFKVGIADGCATIADPLFNAPADSSVISCWIGSTAFMLQLYMDFLGYTQIARGVSLLFNIELPPNFDHPGLASNLADLFSRWQISLSQWLHDYVFVPLGGNKRSLIRRCFAVFVTLVLAGIWHGAGLKFVVMGVYLGASVCLYHLYRRLRPRQLQRALSTPALSMFYTLSAHILVLLIVLGATVIFRAADATAAGIILSRMANLPALPAELSQVFSSGQFMPLVTFVLLWAILLSGPKAVEWYRRIYEPLPHWVRLQGATAASVLCWVLAAAPTKPFLYFQF